MYCFLYLSVHIYIWAEAQMGRSKTKKNQEMWNYLLSEAESSSRFFVISLAASSWNCCSSASESRRLKQIRSPGRCNGIQWTQFIHHCKHPLHIQIATVEPQRDTCCWGRCLWPRAGLSSNLRPRLCGNRRCLSLIPFATLAAVNVYFLINLVINLQINLKKMNVFVNKMERKLQLPFIPHAHTQSSYLGSSPLTTDCIVCIKNLWLLLIKMLIVCVQDNDDNIDFDHRLSY